MKKVENLCYTLSQKKTSSTLSIVVQKQTLGEVGTIGTVI